MLIRSWTLAVFTSVTSCAIALAGCTGDITDSDSEEEPAGPAAPGGPATPGTPGTAPSGGPVAPGNQPAVSGPTACAANQIGFSPLHRLTRLEYDNTIADLLGEDMKPAREFTEDELAGEFSGNFFAGISELQLGQYNAAAETIATRAVTLLPKLLPCDPKTGEDACAASFIAQFGRRAHRRPLARDELDRYQRLYELGKTGDGFAHGLKLVIEAMLETPHFLYLVEGPGPLTQYQLAARLSYFLWKSPPDATLAAAADGGKLGTVEALRAEAKRMLADPRAQRMLSDFHTQWLGLEKVEKLPKDQTLYPGFETLRGLLGEETRRFAASVFNEGDGRLETLLTASFSIVNGPLAAHYGADGKGLGPDTWKKVELNPVQRAGLFTQGSFLAVHGALEGSSPIRRGLAVRERILCAEVPSPPPGADANLPDPTPSATTRERFDKHRTDPSCATCHTMMDMLGYGFESYDGIGRYRTTENGFPVDDSGQVIGTDVDGTFKGARGLAQRLGGSKMVRACVTRQWFRYSLARLDTKLDRCVLDSLVARFERSGGKIPDLITAIVDSDSFRSYRGEE